MLSISAVYPQVLQAQETTCQLSNLNSDDIVDLRDYSIWVSNFLKPFSPQFQGDINQDQKIDLLDYSLLVVNYFNRCPRTPTPLPTTPFATSVPPAVKAFPEAEGFGALSMGGRGGRAIEVINLHDSGPGSLRSCVEATGPRTCIFKVSGTITLLTELKVFPPYLTIAGQTAPGDGILLKNAPSNDDGIISISHTNDIIIRHLKLRTQPSTVPSCCLGPLQIIYGARNIIIDHVSTSWSVDGNLDFVAAAGSDNSIENVTVSWSMITEGLKNSNHVKGAHSTGSLVAGYGGLKGLSMHHNFFAHNNERSPRIHSLGNQSTLDFVNNIIYNPGGIPTVISTDYASVPQVNYVKNFIKEGPETVGVKLIFPLAMTNDLNPPIRLYLNGNYMHNRDADVNNVTNGFLRSSDRGKGNLVSTRFIAPPVTEFSARELMDRVLPRVGANKPNRDAVDTRLIQEAINGTGKIPDHPNDVGGFPTLSGGTAYLDTDRDGMSDAWEISKGHNPQNAADGALDADSDGYTNLEEFINELAKNQ